MMPHLEDLLAESDLAVDEDPVQLPELDVRHVPPEAEGPPIAHHYVALIQIVEGKKSYHYNF